MGNIGAQAVGYLCQDADDLTSFFALQLADMIISFDQFYGLYIDRLPCGRLVMYNSSELALVHGAHRND